MTRGAEDTFSQGFAGSWLVDVVAAAAVVLVFWIPSIQLLTSGGHQLLGGLAAALVSCAMLFRWKFPSAALPVAFASTAVGWLVSATTDPMVGVAWCLYPLALRRRSQTGAAGSVAMAVLVLITLVLGISSPTQDPIQQIVFSLGAVGVAGLLGRTEADRLSAVRRAERQRAEFEQVQREVVMAREVHDVVGHALSTISAQSSIALTVSHSDRRELLETLGDIEHRSRAALEQVQSLVRTLRRRGYPSLGDNGGQRHMATLRELVTAATVSGLEVDAHIDLPECEGEVSFVATRVVQEALSNIIRHAAAERCQLMVAPVEEQLIVRIEDDGTGISANGRAGSGILGMRERVESIGGRLTLAGRLSGGTSVVAEIPLAARK